MELNREYGLETRLILKLLEKDGLGFIKTTAYDTADAYGPAGGDLDYYGISCEGLSHKDIAYNLWNLEDSLLICEKTTSAGVKEKGWVRFIYGNGWGELVADWTTNLFDHEDTVEGRWAHPIYSYGDMEMDELLRAFDIAQSFTELIENAEKHMEGLK